MKATEMLKAHEKVLMENVTNVFHKDSKEKVKEEFLKDLTVPHDVAAATAAAKHKEEASIGGDEDLGYEPGTSIYFGATIALQVGVCTLCFYSCR